MYVGIDDTDSHRGLCTTYVMTELIRELTAQGIDLIGYPRLVRLNPMIPWKTRGNGALCARVGLGRGTKKKIGEILGLPLYSFSQCKEVQDIEILKTTVQQVIERYSEFDDELTNPAFVLAEKKPSPALYWAAVRTVIELKPVKKILNALGAFYQGYKNERGLIGATAAISWRPKDRTFEILTYRKPELWGTKRKIEPESVIAMDRKFRSTFNNYDYLNAHVCIAPNSPCPVLFGIRGVVPEQLEAAMRMIRSELVDRWIIFETNQATDEHIVRKNIAEIQPYTSVAVKARVVSSPHTIPGGHVLLRIADHTGELDAAAYEPSKQFRNIVRKLLPGDKIVAYGGVRSVPRTINLEKLNVLSLAKKIEKSGNPKCPECKKNMKSVGAGKGFRCVRCGKKAPFSAANFVLLHRALKPGWYEPPPSARRHLSKVLKR